MRASRAGSEYAGCEHWSLFDSVVFAELCVCVRVVLVGVEHGWSCERRPQESVWLRDVLSGVCFLADICVAG